MPTSTRRNPVVITLTASLACWLMGGALLVYGCRAISAASRAADAADNASKYWPPLKTPDEPKPHGYADADNPRRAP